MNRPVLELINVSKTYPGGIRALDKVSFELKEKEIHALLGENGAGKSTLIKIISGDLRPDEGKLIYESKETSFKSPIDALLRGIGTVHQNLLLIPSFTVFENIRLYASVLKQKADINVLTEYFKIFNLPNNILTRKIADLPLSLRQKIEIIKILLFRPRILLLDEPTTSLTPLETAEFFDILKKLRDEGKSIVFVTHKVKEAMAISDRITILRRGKKVVTLENKGNLNEEELASLIVGEEYRMRQSVHNIDTIRESTKSGFEEYALLVENLIARDDLGVYRLKGLNLKLKKGELLAIVGVAGNGQKELVECLVGLRKFEKGIIKYFESEYRGVVDFCEVIKKHRVAYITEDRMYTGVAKDLDLVTNIALREICLERENFFLDKRRLTRKAKEIISKYGIKTPSEKALVNQLSGGNIQKLIIARELEINPLLIIAEQPTQGLDVKTTNFVRSLLLSKKGKASILLITYDLEEAIMLADRIIVIYDGKIVAEHSPENIDLRKLSKEMLGVST